MGLCLGIGLSAAWVVTAPAWGAEEPSAARAGLADDVRSGEMRFKEPEMAGLDNTPEGGTLPGGTVPGGTLSGGTLPGGTLPGGTVPGGTVSSDDLPGEDQPNL